MKNSFTSLGIFWCLLFSNFSSAVLAQQSFVFKKEITAGNYSTIKDSVNLTWDEIINKFIIQSANRKVYLSIGVSYLLWSERFSYGNWIAENYFSQLLSFDTDWKYTLIHKSRQPNIWLKLDLSSSPRALYDRKWNSFNPFFINSTIYNLTAVNTRVNSLWLRPPFIFGKNKKWIVNIEFPTFLYFLRDDGFCTPARFQIRSVDGISEEYISNNIGLFVKYTHNGYVTFDIKSSYCFAGDFVEASVAFEPVYQLTPTLNLLI